MHKKCIFSQRNVQSKLAERAEIPLLWLPLDKCSNTDVKLRVPRYFMRKSFFFSPTLALANVHPSNGRELPDTLRCVNGTHILQAQNSCIVLQS